MQLTDLVLNLVGPDVYNAGREPRAICISLPNFHYHPTPYLLAELGS